MLPFLRAREKERGRDKEKRGHMENGGGAKVTRYIVSVTASVTITRRLCQTVRTKGGMEWGEANKYLSWGAAVSPRKLPPACGSIRECLKQYVKAIFLFTRRGTWKSLFLFTSTAHSILVFWLLQCLFTHVTDRVLLVSAYF